MTIDSESTRQLANKAWVQFVSEYKDIADVLDEGQENQIKACIGLLAFNSVRAQLYPDEITTCVSNAAHAKGAIKNILATAAYQIEHKATDAIFNVVTGIVKAVLSPL